MAKDKPKEQAAASAPTPDAAAGAATKKSNPKLKVILLLVAVMLLESATIAVTMMLSKGPQPANAHQAVTDEHAEDHTLVELLVVKEQYPNQKTGRTYVYDTEIYVTVEKKNSEKIKKQIEMMTAALSTDIAVIFRRAEPAQLTEPTLTTLTRQVKAVLDERLGKDAQGNPIVHETLIRKCIQFRADG